MPEIFLQNNFYVSGLVDNPDEAQFQEMSVLGTELSVIEYRPGSHKDNNVIKLNGLSKQADVTFKKGFMKTKALFALLEQVRKGEKNAIRDVTVTLKNQTFEDVATWTLRNARVTKVNYGPLNGKGTDVTMEEVVVAYERLEMEVVA